MKVSKTLICAALFCGCVGSQAATVYDKDDVSLDVFGRIQALGMNDSAAKVSNSSSYSGSDNVVESSARFGVAGRSKLADGIYAIAMGEWEMPAGTGDNGRIKSRYQFAGVDSSNFGILTAGRGDSAFYTVAGASDIYNFLDSRVDDYYLTGDQLPGLVMYSLSALSWDLRLSMGLAQSNVNDTNVSYDDSFAFSVSTTFSHGITVAYGMAYYNFSYGDNASGMKNHFEPQFIKMYGVNGASYLEGHLPSYKIDKGIAVSKGTLGSGLYLAFVYTNTKYDNYKHHLDSFELVSDYCFDSGLGFNLGYGLKRYHDYNLVSEFNLGAYYKVNAAFKVFLEAQIDANSKPEKLYSESYIEDRGLGENKFVIGAEFCY